MSYGDHESQFSSLPIFVMPDEIYRAISDAAARRGMTFSKAFVEMVQDWLAKNQEKEIPKARPLTSKEFLNGR